MNRLLEPSEAYHAVLDWHTTFDIEVSSAAVVDPVRALQQLYRVRPGLASTITRTPEGFTFIPGTEPVVTPTRRGVRAQSPLSSFELNLDPSGTINLSGQIHHALADVTCILTVTDLLLMLCTSETATADLVPEPLWPLAAEIAVGATAGGDAAQVRRRIGQLPTAVLDVAQPVTLHLSASTAHMLDELFAAAGTSLTSVICAIVGAQLHRGDDTGALTAGIPVDCRAFGLAPECQLAQIGNFSHGALVSIPNSTRSAHESLQLSKAIEEDLLGQLNTHMPAHPFLDSTRYLPEVNKPADFVVSNARGAVRRFEHLRAAQVLALLPAASIPGLPMIAVNENPATGAVNISLVAHPADPKIPEPRELIGALAAALTAMEEQP
ncbi:hypothetical protein ABFW00_20910 [Mycobacteroides abscessus]|uniref:hypothetical protein n=1 Tax=Mycobacteroides abscessus TaxID=36809 RepID=UPI0019D1B5DF|nr:hypothetical protein [Mycobacteroides abscessus]MBN7558005.1 hypothetical protein [Mycobacteroides abscessus subsp. abscessus]